VIKIDFKSMYEKVTTPHAYSIYASIGVLVTVGLTIYSTVKQCKENEKRKKPEELTREDVVDEVKSTVKNYIPVAVSAAATIGCINKADSKWQDYVGMVNNGFVAAQDAANRYRMTAPAVAAAEILRGFSGDKAEEGKQWFCLKGAADLKDLYFQSTESEVWQGLYHFNRNFQIRGCASVKELMCFLCIKQEDLPPNDLLGWDSYTFLENGEVPWVDFETWHVNDEKTGEQINCISYMVTPEYSENGTPYAYESEYCPFGYSPYE